jgi:aspartate kinase
MITVGGPGIVGLTDVLARSFAATAATRANVLFVSQSSSQNDICLVIPSSDEKLVVAALRQAFAPEIAEETVEHVSANSNVAIVAVVGENMRGIPGIAGRVFVALGREGVNIIAIAQGSSEYNISLVVESGAAQRALAALHKEFRLHEVVERLREAPSGRSTPSEAVGTKR